MFNSCSYLRFLKLMPRFVRLQCNNFLPFSLKAMVSQLLFFFFCDRFSCFVFFVYILYILNARGEYSAF